MEIVDTDTGLRVERIHHVDASEQDAQGAYDYHYEYDIYRFSQGADAKALRLTARAYIDTPGQASFLSFEVGGGASSRLLRRADLRLPLLRAACDFLRARGMTDIQWLSGRGSGYEAVPESPTPIWSRTTWPRTSGR